MGDWSKYLPSLTEAEARQALRKHWRRGMAVAVGVFLTIALVTFLLPRTYYSEAKLLVKPGWETVALDPTATTGQTLSIYESRETEINSILEVLRSREVTEGVVDLLGIDALLYRGVVPEISIDRARQAPHQRSKWDSAREQAVLMLEQSMQIWIPKKSNTIALRCEANSPELAQAINNSYLAVYRTIHADVNHTKGSYNFFVDQQAVLRDRWQSATTELRDAKDRMGVATLEGRRTMLEGQLSDVGEKMLATESEVAATEGKIASLRSKLQQIPKFTETTRSENASVAASLFALQMRQKDLQSRYTAAHPLMQDVNQQVGELQRLIDDESRTRVQSTSSLNPAWSQLESSLLVESASLDSLKARATSLQQQREDLLATLRTLNNDEIRLTELQQAVDVAEKSYYETSERVEQARIHQELSRDRITNVNVFQPASFVTKPIAPKRSLILALGLFVSAISGVATILSLAHLQRHFTSLDEVSERLKLPVVGTLSSPSLRPAI